MPLCRCALEISSRCFGFLQSLGQAGTSLELLGGLSFIFFKGGRVEAVSFTSGSFQNSSAADTSASRFVLIAKVTTKGLFSTFLWPKYCATISAIGVIVLCHSCFATHDLQPSNSCRSLDRVRLSPAPQCASATNARTVWDPSKYHSGILTLLLTFGDRITQKLC